MGGNVLCILSEISSSLSLPQLAKNRNSGHGISRPYSTKIIKLVKLHKFKGFHVFKVKVRVVKKWNCLVFGYK